MRERVPQLRLDGSEDSGVVFESERAEALRLFDPRAFRDLTYAGQCSQTSLEVDTDDSDD